MKSRTLAGVAAVGGLAIIVAVTLLSRQRQRYGGPHVRRRAARHPGRAAQSAGRGGGQHPRLLVDGTPGGLRQALPRPRRRIPTEIPEQPPVEVPRPEPHLRQHQGQCLLLRRPGATTSPTTRRSSCPSSTRPSAPWRLRSSSRTKWATRSRHERGPRECATFTSGNVVTTELPFQTAHRRHGHGAVLSDDWARAAQSQAGCRPPEWTRSFSKSASPAAGSCRSRPQPRRSTCRRATSTRCTSRC